MRPRSAKKRFGIATFTGFMSDSAQGPRREPATDMAFAGLTPRATNLLNRVWQLLIQRLIIKHLSLRRIHLSRSRSTVGVSYQDAFNDINVSDLRQSRRLEICEPLKAGRQTWSRLKAATPIASSDQAACLRLPAA